MESTRYAFTPTDTRPRSKNTRLILFAVIGGAVFLVVVATIVLAVVIPKQISYLEYYEYGFKREKSSGEVQLDKVYTAGRHWLGQDYDFLKFRADAHHINLENITVFTKDRLESKWNVDLLYFIRQEELPSLYETYNTTYPEVIEGLVVNALKSVAPYFGMLDREKTQDQLRLGVRESVGGRCCSPNCNDTRFELACFPGCRPTSVCIESDKGLHVDIANVQLGMSQIPGNVLARYLTAQVLTEEAERELYLQEATIIRKESENLIRHIKAETEEILSNATDQSDAVIEETKTDYVGTLEQALINGLLDSFRYFNLTEEERTSSAAYVQTLVDQGHFRPNITFIHGSDPN